MPEGRGRIGVLAKRLEAAELIADNLALLEWVFKDDTNIKRADLTDQDKV